MSHQPPPAARDQRIRCDHLPLAPASRYRAPATSASTPTRPESAHPGLRAAPRIRFRINPARTAKVSTRPELKQPATHPGPGTSPRRTAAREVPHTRPRPRSPPARALSRESPASQRPRSGITGVLRETSPHRLPGGHRAIHPDRRLILAPTALNPRVSPDRATRGLGVGAPGEPERAPSRPPRDDASGGDIANQKLATVRGVSPRGF